MYRPTILHYKTFCPMSLCEIVSPLFVDSFEGQIVEHRQHHKGYIISTSVCLCSVIWPFTVNKYCAAEL